MVSSTPTIADLPVPDDRLLSEIVQELGLSKRNGVETVKHLLKAHAFAFAMSRFVQSEYPTVHQDAKRMATLGDTLDATLKLLSEASPLTLMPIDMTLNQDSDGVRSLSQMKRDLTSLRDVARKFAAIPFAKKQPDAVLRNAVGGLMLLLEKVTGDRALASGRQTDLGREPALSSPQAIAIGKLLRVAEPSLQTTTLANVIIAIRREAGQDSLDEFSHQLRLGGKVTPF